MTGGTRLLVLSAGVGSGHNSAAKAVADAAGARDDVADVQVVDVLADTTTLYRDVVAKGYFALVAGLPWLVEWGYDVSDQPFRRRGPIDPITRANALPVIRMIRRQRPTAIVSTHFLPAQLVAAMLLRGVVRARTGVVTTDYDFQGLWLTGAMHAFFLAREESRAQLIALGLPPDRLRTSGIPIGATAPPAPPNDGPPALLVSAGAAGGDYAEAVVRQTLHLTQPFTATVVCGRDAALKARIEALVARRGEQFRVLGYTDDMPRLLAEADLFIGKPGGLSSSECMAAGLPMVLVNPIPGQEVLNGDYLMEQGAAVRCNETASLAWKLDGLLGDPERLARMQAAAARIGRPDAAAIVLDAVLSGPATPLVVSRAAQRSILTASEQHLVAADLTGTDRVVTLADAASGRAAAVLRADEVDALRRLTGARTGPIALDAAAVSRLPPARRDLQRVLRVLARAQHPLVLEPAE